LAQILAGGAPMAAPLANLCADSGEPQRRVSIALRANTRHTRECAADPAR
jgi:hypothetical protein